MPVSNAKPRWPGRDYHRISTQHTEPSSSDPGDEEERRSKGASRLARAALANVGGGRGRVGRGSAGWAVGIGCNRLILYMVIVVIRKLDKRTLNMYICPRSHGLSDRNRMLRQPCLATWRRPLRFRFRRIGRHEQDYWN